MNKCTKSPEFEDERKRLPEVARLLERANLARRYQPGSTSAFPLCYLPQTFTVRDILPVEGLYVVVRLLLAVSHYTTLKPINY